jgi:hypothetical protein
MEVGRSARLYADSKSLLVNANEMLINFTCMHETSYRKTSLAIAQILMLGKLAINQTLDNLEIINYGYLDEEESSSRYAFKHRWYTARVCTPSMMKLLVSICPSTCAEISFKSNLSVRILSFRLLLVIFWMRIPYLPQ